MQRKLTASPKKLRRLLKEGEISLENIPLERLRPRQVRKIVVFLTVLNQEEIWKRSGVMQPTTHGQIITLNEKPTRN
jgi:hypothetical protein